LETAWNSTAFTAEQKKDQCTGIWALEDKIVPPELSDSGRA
jgi:hypothetical protein